MARAWDCEQCGHSHSHGFIESFGGPPEECENCGHDEFSEVGEPGALYLLVEDPERLLRRRQTRRRILYWGGSGAVVLGGLWWTTGRATVKTTNQVTLKGTQFHPRNVEVDVGTTVTWTNKAKPPAGADKAPTFTVASATGNWDFKKPVPPGESVSYTFDQSGVYGAYDPLRGEKNPLRGMSMKIGVGTSIDDPLGGWF